jgi:hypothetical protein
MKRLKPVVFLLCALVLAGCSRNSPIEPIIPSPRPLGHAMFVPGEVVVGVDSVTTYAFFESFIDSLHLGILEWSYDEVIFWIEIPPGTADTIIAELSTDTLFSGIYQAGYPFSDSVSGKEYLHAIYKYGKDASDTTAGRIAVQNLGLTLRRVEVYSMGPYRNAVISVPLGREKHWVEKLKTYPFIRYAELNYYVYIWGR